MIQPIKTAHKKSLLASTHRFILLQHIEKRILNLKKREEENGNNSIKIISLHTRPSFFQLPIQFQKQIQPSTRLDNNNVMIGAIQFVHVCTSGSDYMTFARVRDVALAAYVCARIGL